MRRSLAVRHQTILMRDPSPTIARQLLELQQRFSAEIPARLAGIEDDWTTAKSVSGQGFEAGDLYRKVHSLAGSAGTFGFEALGACARQLEHRLDTLKGQLLSPAEITLVEQAIDALRECASQAPAPVSTARQAEGQQEKQAEKDSADERSLVYVLEDDGTLASEVASQLDHFGYRVETFPDAASLRARVETAPPDALLADIHLPEGGHGGVEAINALRDGALAKVPVVFMSGHDTWEDRLSAVRAGGQDYLSKPINFTSLVERLDEYTGKKQQGDYRILIVEDTLILAQHFAAVLGDAGMHAEIVSDPATLLDVIPGFNPDLILMDIFMPGCTGIEAAQVIRQHSGYRNIPIVYLSTEKSLQQQLSALRIGGDDFLEKPITDSHLVAAVRIRARRFRELTALMNRDSLTGLYNHINLKLLLEREIAQTLRRGSVMSFVMLDLDHFKNINDSYGHPVGDRVIKALARLLRQRLRKSDVAGRYGGEEFAMILPDTPPEAAVRLVDDLRASFASINHAYPGGEFSATFSAGIATCPAHAEVDALISSADQALYDAKEGGRDRVALAD